MKKTLCIALTLCLALALFVPFAALTASAATEGIYTYTVSNNEATITLCDVYVSGDIVIPDTLGGYPVVAIGDAAFQNCTTLTSVTIPDSVTSMGDSAFDYCLRLASITIPDGVTSIGYEAFQLCTSLASVNFGENSQLSSIGESAFSRCTALTSITIPDGVTSIGYCAFFRCIALESVNFGENSQLSSIGQSAFEYCTALTSITIPGSVTSIGYDAFYDCTALTSITISEGVTSIDESAFSGCTALASITIPDSVTSIGYAAFNGCTALTSITIPEGVTNIAHRAFPDCTALASATILGNPTFGESVFDNTASDLTLYGYEGSTVETYAAENAIPFVPILTLWISAEHGTVSVQIGDAAAVQVDGAKSFAPAAGETVTLTAAGAGAFQFWKNVRSGTVISTNKTLSFTFGGSDLSLIAVFAAEEAPGEADTYTVYFRDSLTGKLVQSLEVAAGYVLTQADLPTVSFVGYTFTGWKIGSLDALGYPVTRTAVALSQYEKDPNVVKHLLTIDRGGPAPSTTYRAFNRVAILVNARAGFSGWKMDGAFVSVDSHYVFGMPNRDVTLTAAYNETAPEAVAANIGLSNSNNVLYYTLSRSVKESYAILETGTLLTRKAAASDLTVDTAVKSVTKTISTAPESYDVIGFRKDASTKPGTWLFRGYVTYIDAESNVSTVYSDVVSTTVE